MTECPFISLPFSSHSQAHFDRLHLFRCSTSEISWRWHTERTFWKCRISKRCFYYRYKLLPLYI